MVPSMSEMDFWLLAMGRWIMKIEKYVGCGIGGQVVEQLGCAEHIGGISF